MAIFSHRPDTPSLSPSIGLIGECFGLQGLEVESQQGHTGVVMCPRWVPDTKSTGRLTVHPYTPFSKISGSESLGARSQDVIDS
jgi:hypothetical protein